LMLRAMRCKEIPHRHSREWPGGSARTALD
jgi:hypothetical protein